MAEGRHPIRRATWPMLISANFEIPVDLNLTSTRTNASAQASSMRAALVREPTARQRRGSMQRAASNTAIFTGFMLLIWTGGTGWTQQHAHPAGPAAILHPDHAGPANVTVEFENDAIRVLRIRMAPNEKTPMHEITARFVVWLTDAHLRDTAPDGRTDDIHRRAGAVEWVPTRQHAGENLDDR